MFNHFQTGGSVWRHTSNAGPVQEPQIMTSDQRQHHLLTGISTKNTIKAKTFDRNI